MNRAVILKTARDTAWLLVIVLLGVLLFEMLFVLAMSRMSEELLGIWRRIPVIGDILRVLFGVDISQDVSATSLMTLGLVHPVMFAITWACLIATCTRAISGEIDNGTADLLLTLPVSRASVYASVSVVWVFASAAMCLAVWSGLALGGLTFGAPEPLNLRRLVIPTANLLALYLAIGAGSMFVSACFSRRSIAVAVMIAVLLASFFVNFLEVFVSGVRGISFLGLLHYHRPIECVRTGEWPLGDLGVLAAIAITAWLAGQWRFCRRDIPAV